MLSALYGSGALDGLARRLKHRWPVLSATDGDKVLAEAVDALYVAVKQGKDIRDLIGWLWKTCHNLAYDCHEGQRERPMEAAGVDRLTAQRWFREQRTGPPETEGEDEAERRRARAIATMKSVLPRLGGTNIQAVMTYVLQAVEDGSPHIAHREVGEALAIDPSYVRVLVHRGWERLERIAREEGLVHADFSLLGAEEDDGDEPAEEDQDRQDEI